MADIDLWQASFNGGEATPLLDGREDLNKYPTLCRRIRNAHGLIQGPARRRTGSGYRNAAKSNGEGWLVPFIRSRSEAFMLEFGENYIRFYRNRDLIMSGMSPFEVATPWTYADLTDTDNTFKLRYVQSNDILYLFDGVNPVKQLNHFADDNWTLTDYATVGGPFDSQNTDTAITVYASAATGTGITLTASSAIFTAGRVGSLMRLQPAHLTDLPPWEPSKRFALNSLARRDGKTYKTLSDETVGGHPASMLFTGSVGPSHEDGIASDGQGQIVDPIDGTGDPRDTGHNWEFQDPGYGIVKITAVAGDGLTATANVQPWRIGSTERLPAEVVGSGNTTKRWSWGLFSIANGFPRAGTFFRERMVLITSRQLVFSVPASFTEFNQELAGQILADNAFVADIASDKDETIQWALPLKEALIIGTTGGEHAVMELTSNQAFGPENRKITPQTGHGSNGVTPLRVGSIGLFVESSGLRIRAVAPSPDVANQFSADSQNDLSEHLTYSGIVQTTFQEKPDNFMWALRYDGLLACLTFSREQDIYGWSLHYIGGFRDASKLRAARVRSIATIPSPDGTRDELWLWVERRINGSTVRYIEVMTDAGATPPQWEYESNDAYARRLADHQCKGIYMDSAASYDVPKTVTAVSLGTSITVTSASHGFANGSEVRFDELVGPWELNARVYTVSDTATNTFKLKDDSGAYVDGSSFPAYVSGGVVRLLVSTLTGLDAWEGETVQVLADGAVHPDRVVSGGSITLQAPAARVLTGLGYSTIIETMRPSGGNPKGSGQSRLGRIDKVYIRLSDSLGGSLGPTLDDLSPLETRVPSDVMGLPPRLFTGDIEADWKDEYSTIRTVVFVQDQPLPTTIIGFGTDMAVNPQ